MVKYFCIFGRRYITVGQMVRTFFLILSVLIASCSRNAPSPPNVLRIRISADPTTLDPRKASDFVSATIVSLLYEGLTRCLPDGTVEMGLAERVEVSKDGKRYLFHLRKAFWSDGTPITASDFEASWKQILCP